MTRHEDYHCSNIKIFSTQFYTTLEGKGSTSVEKWTKHKNIDVFEKKFLFIPINKTLVTRCNSKSRSPTKLL